MNPARPPGGFPLFGNYTAGKLLPKNTCLTEPLELEPVRFQRPYFGRPLCPFRRLTWRASFGTVASDDQIRIAGVCCGPTPVTSPFLN